MEYNTYIPSSDLTHFVKLFWSLDAPAASFIKRQRIVPDGCMEMIFHYGDLYEQFMENGNSFLQPRSFVFGQITRPLEIAPTGCTGIIAARFQPDGFAPFNMIRVNKMENQPISVIDLFGDKGRQLENEVLSTQYNEGRVKAIESFLLNQLSSQHVVDNISKSSVEVLLKLRGQLTVDELANQLGINRRQLERRFSSTIGLSPKQLSKIIRLQATLKMLEQKHFSSLTSLAYESGYFDQAHFIKDFKEFTGLSPRQFYADSLKMASLFIDTE